MRNWDFRAWQAALGALDSRAAALVGLAAAERISGCLADGRFQRHGGSTAAVVRDLLDECWAGILGGDGAASTRTSLPAEQLARETERYTDLSLRELLHSYEPFGVDEDETPDDEAVDGVDEFLEEAEPEGAVAMHLDALMAVQEAVVACDGGPWDGALRCLQITAMAADRYEPGLPGPGLETQRQAEDLALVRAAGSAGLRHLATELRTRARVDASGWQRATERLDLLHDD